VKIIAKATRKGNFIKKKINCEFARRFAVEENVLPTQTVVRANRISFRLRRFYRLENRMHAVTRVSAYVTNRMRFVCNISHCTVGVLPPEQSHKSKFRETRSLEYKIHMHKALLPFLFKFTPRSIERFGIFA